MKTKNKKDADERYRAPALDKGLDILELLAQQPAGMTRAEIVKAMGRSPSEVYRMVERLVARQYVDRSSDRNRYALSIKLFLMGSAHPPTRRLIATAQPLMDEYARHSNQSIHFATPEAGYAIVIAQASKPANWEFRLRVGAELDLTSTSSGKTLLAFQDDERRNELLVSSNSKFAEWSAQQRQIFYDELDTIRQTGYRVHNSAQLVGVTDITVPALDKNVNAFGVLTCPFMQRVKSNSTEENSSSLDSSLEETKHLMLELGESLSFT